MTGGDSFDTYTMTMLCRNRTRQKPTEHSFCQFLATLLHSADPYVADTSMVTKRHVMLFKFLF